MRHALLLVFLLPGLAPAAGVVGNGTPGSCTEAALNAALSGGGIVTFSCGGSAVTIPITSTKTISAALATDVDGGGLVTLDGQDAVRIFSVDYQRQLALRNLTLRRGRAVDYGAGVRSAFHERGTQALTVANVRFEDNVCTQAGDDVGGGALYLLGGVSTVDAGTFLRNRGGNGGAVGYLGGDGTGPANGLTIRDSVFVGNETQARVSSFGATGGAIYVDGAGDGEVRIERCAFRDNVAWAGGAIHSVMYQSPQALVIVDSTFLENRATGGNGGAIYHQDGALNFTGSLVAGNGAYSQGGGLWLYHPTAATVTNVTFTGNRAEGAVAPSGYAIGGAFSIYPSGPNVTLSHLTVTHNHAGWTGGGITVAAPASNVTIRASIVAHNTAANGGNPWNIGKNCDVGSPQMTNGGDVIEFPQRNLGDGNDENCVAVPVIADPRLGPLADHGGLVETVSLLPGSPAVDAAFAGCWSAVDARGAARPAGVRCDVGAFEGTETAVRFYAVSPCRVLDTRLGSGTPVSANGTLSFDAAGTCGVPADARALAVNVTGVVPAADGVLRLSGAGSATPVSQVLALRTGRTRASAAVAVPGALGRLRVRNDSALGTHVILDVSGYFR
ncbi:MAG: right-handed parallel beta-helix repeat-containing protein [Holophagales bacterium]|nr:right-handed parallel beta-helix repeat-containing protein [Holophagales bacterium]